MTHQLIKFIHFGYFYIFFIIIAWRFIGSTESTFRAIFITTI